MSCFFLLDARIPQSCLVRYREEEELYALDSFCTFIEVGDDLTGLKVSKSSLQMRRRGQSIRDSDSDFARGSLTIRVKLE